MEVKLIFDGEGNLMIVDNSGVHYYYVEYPHMLPGKLEDMIDAIAKFK